MRRDPCRGTRQGTPSSDYAREMEGGRAEPFH